MAAVLDPTGITSLVELGAKILLKIANYIRDCVHVPDTVAEIQSRVAIFEIQLKALQSLNNEGDLTDHAKEGLETAGILSDCWDCLAELDHLVGEAPKVDSGAKVSFRDRLKQLTWPAKSQDKAKEQLARLDHHREDIKHFLMTDTLWVDLSLSHQTTRTDFDAGPE